MQQAYRALRVVAEAQTIRMTLAPQPGELMLRELATACTTLDTPGSKGVKAVVLDFTTARQHADVEGEMPSQVAIDAACVAVHTVSQPVLAVVLGRLSSAGSALVRVADLILVAHDASLIVQSTESGTETLSGTEAFRLGYVTWSIPAQNVDREMERILDLLRAKSAAALRLVKASVRLGQTHHDSRLEPLKQVNTLYLTQVMQTSDAHEGLHAFLEKRSPEWRNV